MDINSKIQQTALKLRALKLSSNKNDRWVCAVGKHQDVWDYIILDSFENCLDSAWSVLQHEVDLHKNQFKSKLRKHKGYIGECAEIKKLPKNIIFSSGLNIGKAVLIFDSPDEISVGLSRPVYAAFYSYCPDVIFGHDIFCNLSHKKIQGQLAQWTNLKFLDGKYNLKNELYWENLRFSNYPLIVTSSPFILGKVFSEGLIGCLISNPISLISNPDRGEPEGILEPIYNWLAPFPKKLFLIEEKMKRLDEDGYYSENIAYQKYFSSIIPKIEYQCQKLSTSLTIINVDPLASAKQIVEKIKKHF